MKAFNIKPGAKVYVYGEPINMGSSFPKLTKLTEEKLLEKPLSGDLFLFLNKKKTYLKTLFFEKGGFCIFAKKLEAGTFEDVLGEGELNVRRLEDIINNVVIGNAKNAGHKIKRAA